MAAALLDYTLQWEDCERKQENRKVAFFNFYPPPLSGWARAFVSTLNAGSSIASVCNPPTPPSVEHTRFYGIINILYEERKNVVIYSIEWHLQQNFRR
ncbi:hypothetical protein DMENIID0001_062210 [Sergentomyia squamirostris]